MAWIAIKIKPESHQIMLLSEQTGESPEKVYCAVIRWFFYIDEHYVEGVPLSVTEATFHRVTGWTGEKSLAEAMQHPEVDWLEMTQDGRLSPTRPDCHFGRSARQRRSDAQRAAAYRARQSRSHDAPKRVAAKSSPAEDADNPIRLVESVAKRSLRPEERAAVAREEERQSQCPPVVIHGESVPALVLWRRAIAHLPHEPTFSFSTGTALLRYVGSMVARCADEGVWPGEKPPTVERHHVNGTDEHAIKAGVADGLARAAAARRVKR